MIWKDQKFYLTLLVPVILVLLLFIAAPIGQSFFLSFHRIIIGLPQLKTPFVGLDNYQELLNDPVARHSFWITVIFVSTTTFFELLIGLLLALLIHHRFPGRGLFFGSFLMVRFIGLQDPDTGNRDSAAVVAIFFAGVLSFCY